ncbi:N-acetylneuraminate synthase family protein [Desulfobacula sp.]|uniref:N-acetylneuraminate synthase family protein n=1 Tax=Desulfobacula sp. TaxID=2593537 RepID=UPI0026209952|nr:N-acetylneuraminate synthase family protein [Desulfobacula sp.]
MKFQKEIFINDRKIGFNSPTYFIADIAANHDGDIERAKSLIYLVKEMGGDAVKFQHHNVEKYVSDLGFKSLGNKFSHQKSWNKTIFEVYKDAEVPVEWTPILKKYCDEIGISFFSTPYDLDMIDHLNPYVSAFKVGSGDINRDDMLIKMALTDKPVLFACGASTMDEVKHAVNTLSVHTPKIVLMQCNTNYTASIENFKYINLNVLNSFKKLFPDLILGLSDHTPGSITALGSVALGARVIEKHFTDDNDRQGPDHKFSMNPKSWAEMVKNVKILEQSLGDSVKKVEENEKETLILQRRAIRVIKDLSKGTVISRQNIEFQRPAPSDCFSPNDFDKLNKKRLKHDIKKGDYLKYENFDW